MITSKAKRLLPRVAVGLSGGVDSSVAALLLLQRGYDVIGVHMNNWDAKDEQADDGACPETQDFKDAQEVSRQLGIPIHQANFMKLYWTNVFAPFLEDYERGLTPNPDVLCNREIKFRHFLDYATTRLNAPYVATGHYVRLSTPFPAEKEIGKQPIEHPPHLLMGVDTSKDQSYFLSHVPTEAFRRVLFPLGGLYKSQVRETARLAGLVTAEKKESMGICFVGKRRLDSFLPNYLEPKQGVFVSIMDRKILGQHQGAALFTVGQGAKIGGSSKKWFVCGKDMQTGEVFVAPGTHHPSLYFGSLVVDASAFNWIGAPPAQLSLGHPLDCQYRVRYRQPLGDCTIRIVDTSTNSDAATYSSSGSTVSSSDSPAAPQKKEKKEKDMEDMISSILASSRRIKREESQAKEGALLLRVDFHHPQRAVAAKQTLALYRGDRCLGGGAILSCCPSYYEMGKDLPDERIDWAVS